MKKVVFGFLIALATVTISLPAQAASTNNFTITSYDVNMTLGRDAEKRSVVKVQETITADFPMSNQNHGLERAFVKDYNGHSLSLNLEGVTDASGKKLPYPLDW